MRKNPNTGFAPVALAATIPSNRDKLVNRDDACQGEHTPFVALLWLAANTDRNPNPTGTVDGLVLVGNGLPRSR
jgi:hypothetical protein